MNYRNLSGEDRELLDKIALEVMKIYLNKRENTLFVDDGWTNDVLAQGSYSLAYAMLTAKARLVAELDKE